jgi:hypothetical protein
MGDVIGAGAALDPRAPAYPVDVLELVADALLRELLKFRRQARIVLRFNGVKDFLLILLADPLREADAFLLRDVLAVAGFRAGGAGRHDRCLARFAGRERRRDVRVQVVRDTARLDT